MAYKLVLSIVVGVAAYLVGTYYLFPSPVKSPLVEIATGKLQGRISQSRDGRNYLEYLGVPYAQPPLLELRYEPPEPLVQKWEGVRDATKLGAECIQVDTLMHQVVGKEDCLFLNIHTPTLDGLKPVVVWLHGGGFAFGTGNIYRPDYFMDENVVLVTVNYRLSSFGFLNTGDGVVRGNAGLKDQNMALRWVRDNIQKFGGNPKDVTLFGESAGGASTNLQMLSKMSKGLFHKAISQSGLASMRWAVYPNPAKQARRFAAQANCPTENSREMVKCLKSRDALELVSIHKECIDKLHPTIAMFFPTLEKEVGDGKSFLTEDPVKIIESGQFNQIPFMTGVNSAEGLILSSVIVANKTFARHVVNNWAESLQNLLVIRDDVDPAIFEQIKEFYFKGGDGLDPENAWNQIENLTNLFSDGIFKHGFHLGATSHTKALTPKSPPLFLYYYTYQGDFGLDQILLAIKGELFHPLVEIIWSRVVNWAKVTFMGAEIPRYGACHGDELAMQFYVPLLASVPKGSRDYEFSKKLINLVMQFVKLDTKQKEPKLEFMGQTWSPQASDKPLRLMQLDLKPKMIAVPFTQSLAFWDSLNIRKNTKVSL